MTRIDDFSDVAPRDDDEGLFARGIDGQLVRLDAPTEKDYSKQVTVQIDGQPIVVPLAEPLKDAQGNVILDIDGKTTPKYTTIFDAAQRLYENVPGGKQAIPIPIMCHQPHMPPVAVCRLCVVQIYGQKRGKRAPERKLLPACQHQVKDGMEVFTMMHTQPAKDKDGKPKVGPDGQPEVEYSPDADKVASAVRAMTELLAADHLKVAPDPVPNPSARKRGELDGLKQDLAKFNELQWMADRLSERCGCQIAGDNRLKNDLFIQDPVPAPPTPLRETTAIGSVKGRGAGQGSLSSHPGIPSAPPPATPGGASPHDRGSGGAPVPLTVNGGPGHWPVDRSSPTFLVDHSACILCDRCWRACVDIKHNNVIGRVGKGATAGIGFDLNDPMGQSTCVQCGECMVSCPTSAITFKPVAKEISDGKGSHGGERTKTKDSRGRATPLKATELAAVPLFSEIPGKFLLWQEGLAVKREVNTGDVLCRQGEPGNTAYLLRSGKLQVTTHPTAAKGGRKEAGKSWPVGIDPANADKPVILGEMACLSGTPRTADITAAEPSEVWEIRRNVLDRLMRSPANKKMLDEMYRGRALEVALRSSDLFQGMSNEEYVQYSDFLRPRLKFVSVPPGQTIFRQGEFANSGMYLVRLGHVRVEIGRSSGDLVSDHFFRGPGTVIGEIGLLALDPADLARGLDPARLDAQIGEALGATPDDQLGMALPAGQRTATCKSLDHVELAHLNRSDFLTMIKQFPKLRRKLIELAVGRLVGENDRSPFLRQFIEHGLYQAQNLLALDLTKCTHCDECTRACIEKHGTRSHGTEVTRLLRDGVHFGQYLVATSCRSCRDAYCMIGCPVDAIHRGKHQQIVIEDHCIGCGLCANNCPYGNISMVKNEGLRVEAPDMAHPGKTAWVYQKKASTCDQCDPAGGEAAPKPRCVMACPHDAAHRMTGPELLGLVTTSSKRGLV